MASEHRDRRIAEIAALQCGVVSTRQLAAIGVGHNGVAHRVANGRLHRLHRGVYVVGHRALAEGAREWAAVLVCLGRAMVSHRAAAERWGMLRRPTQPGPIEVTVIGRRGTHRPGVVVHTRRRDAPEDWEVHEGLPVTSAARTVLDLAATCPGREVDRAFEQTGVLGLASVDDVTAALHRDPKSRGAPVVAALLRAAADPALTRSEAESRLLGLVRAAELPRPRANAQVMGYEVDLLWWSQRLVVEVDGYRFHRHRAAFERDRDRANRLQLAGFRVLRVTWRQIEAEPLRLVCQLALALERPSSMHSARA